MAGTRAIRGNAAAWIAWATLLWAALSCADPWTGLASPDPAARIDAARRAGAARDGAAINKLVDLLYDPDPAVAAAAEAALGRMDAKGARVLMDHVAGTLDPGVRVRLVRAAIAIGPAAGRQVAESLEIESAVLPAAVREVLASYSDDGIVPALSVLDDGPLAARRPLSEILIRLGAPVVPAVIRAADPSRPAFQRELAAILTKIGRPAIDGLAAALGAPDDRRAKAGSLLPLVVADAPGEVVAVLGAVDPAVAKSFLASLRDGGAATQAILADALLLPDPGARARALQALADLGWKAATPIDAARERYAQGQDAEALAALEALVRDPATREAARRTLERLGAAACPVAERLKADADPALRAGAVAIARGASCADALDDAFDHFLYDRSNRVRAEALAAIQAAGGNVGDHVRGLPPASIASLARQAEAQRDLVTLSVLADALPGTPASARAERALAAAAAEFAARPGSVGIAHIRTQQTTAVPRGVPLTGVAEGEIEDAGGPYRIEMTVDEGGDAVLAYLTEAEVTKDEPVAKRARYRYRLALEPRYVARAGLVTVAGTITVVRASDGTPAARHSFVQDIEVTAARAPMPADAFACYGLARRAASVAASVPDAMPDPAALARRTEAQAAWSRYGIVLSDLSRSGDPEVAGAARLALAMLGK